MTSIIYGLSRSRELVDFCRKFGFGVSYQEIKDLLASWAKAEAKNGSFPSEIANKYPAVVVMDNDDFKTKTFNKSIGHKPWNYCDVCPKQRFNRAQCP